MNHRATVDHNRSVAEITAELKDETKEFLYTRYEMLKAEIQEKWPKLKAAFPLLAIGLLLLITGWLMLNAGLTALLAHILAPNPFRWVFSFLIVGGLWIILGAIAVYFGKVQLNPKSLLPARTIKVLQKDKLWLQKEATGKL